MILSLDQIEGDEDDARKLCRTALLHELVRFSRQLDATTGMIALRGHNQSTFCLLRTNDALLLGQALRGPMNRSAKRKLHKRVFLNVPRRTLSHEYIDTLKDIHPTDGEQNPFIHFMFGTHNQPEYTIVYADRLRCFELVLYIEQRAFRDYIFRSM